MDSKKVNDKKLQSWSEINKERKRKKKEYKEKAIEAKKLKEMKQEVESAKNETAKNSIEEKKEISTLSIALPGSVLENAQTEELRAYLAGQIARAVCLYQVDEVIVFDDYADEDKSKATSVEDDFGFKTIRHCCGQLARILQYLECPQYLRKHFFPIHKDLKYSGLMNPLNAPHHLSSKDESEFREGVVTNKPVKPGKGSIVYIGLRQDVHVDKLLVEGARCTVKLHMDTMNTKKLKGIVVSPDIPRKETGIYWGYRVRLAKSLAQVFSECPYKDGYDLTIGTSDKGSSIDSFHCPSYKHALIMFGGVQGLEFALENDQTIKENDPELIFDHYLNTLPGQGSKTIRTEEAILISLAGLRSKLNPKFPPVSFNQNNGTNTIISPNNESIENVEDMSRFD
ncbi:putative methyltransferase C9orf114 [Coccinella septempunctata]|uniref:putative methyltransferase C9orf114 n=1 Tax=Coccinella septempunctata TaxID=41139 RepID=UPI001D06500E|nr:putative methyltransferase C9orf114 [Coccinella septempunctata]